MDFNKFLPNEEEITEELSVEVTSKINQNQVYDIITSRKPGWQAIIYDLIHTEQLDPWDIDLVVLTQKYFEKIQELEESDFYISSKVLLAAALLLRIKSEFLLNKHIKTIDDILFGKKDDKKFSIERIEIDEDDLPELIPKTPLPRLKKVTLQELMVALGKAIDTESRRIKREVAIKRAKKLSHISIPEFKRIDLKSRIREFYARVMTIIKKQAITIEKEHNKIGFNDLIGDNKEEKIATFLPMLHLSNTKKFWLEQDGHLEEIYIYLYKYFDKNRDKFIEDYKSSLEDSEELINAAEEIEISEVDQERKDRLKKARLEKKQMKESAAKELAEELGIEISEEIKEFARHEKIDDVTGFSQEQQ